MPDHPIEAWHLKLDRLPAAAREMSDHLSQAEQLEMADQESTVKHDEPAEKASGNRDRDKRRRLDLPNDRRDWLPLPEQQQKRQARQQHIGAAFERSRGDVRKQLLEALSRHAAVLDGEERHQRKVDNQGMQRRVRRTTIDCLQYQELRHEADSV